MFPILEAEVRNATYVYQMLVGDPVDPVEFDKLLFKEGKKPERPKALEKKKPPAKKLDEDEDLTG